MKLPTHIEQPIVAQPKRDVVRDAISSAFGDKPPQPIVTGMYRQKLRWHKPDGKGGT